MELLIGRNVKGENARVIDNPYVSATHCRIWLDEQSNIYYIQDTGSTNGTFVNGVLIKQMAIKGDDKILLGGDGGYETTLEELLRTAEHHEPEHDIAALRKIYESYQRDMSGFKTKAQVYTSMRIIPSVLISAGAVIFTVNDNGMLAIVSAAAVIICLIISTILISRNEKKMKDRVTRFQLTYVCPKTRRFYGDRSWEVLQNEGICSHCKSKFK